MSLGIERPEWMAEANCRGTDPDIFYPERGESGAEAKRICAGCDVRDDCLDHALAHVERNGVWGGKSEAERRRIRGVRFRSGVTRSCGWCNQPFTALNVTQLYCCAAHASSAASAKSRRRVG